MTRKNLLLERGEDIEKLVSSDMTVQGAVQEIQSCYMPIISDDIFHVMGDTVSKSRLFTPSLKDSIAIR